MELCYMACLSRGGSNLLAALMHGNPSIYAIALRSWRHFINADGANIKGLIRHIRDTKKSIYFRGGFAKNLRKVDMLLIDKFIDKRIVKPPSNGKVITLIRNPFAIVNSMHSYAKKYKFKAWVQNPSRAVDVANRFVNLVRFSNKSEHSKMFSFDELLVNINDSLKKVYEHLGIQFKPHDSFKSTFGEYGCVRCGGPFKIVNSNCSDASRVLRANDLAYDIEPHFYCAKDDELTLGYGGFNPCREIGTPRSWVGKLNTNLYKAVYNQLLNKLGKRVAKSLASDKVILSELDD